MGEFVLQVSDKSRSYIFCCQRDEIPQWFNYRSMGSSIDIKFSPHCHNNTSLLGFALCIVFEYERRDTFGYHNYRMRFRCVHDYKIPYGNSRRHRWTWENQVLMDIGHRLDESDHMFMQYFRDYDIYYDATEASFEFYLEAVDCNTSVILGKFKVKKCGVCMLYRQDADVFIRREHGFSDVEEPHDHVIGTIHKLLQRFSLYIYMPGYVCASLIMTKL